MAQGEFTKYEAAETKKAVGEIFEALSGRNQTSFLGHLNDIYLFLEAAKAHAPQKVKLKSGK